MKTFSLVCAAIACFSVTETAMAQCSHSHGYSRSYTPQWSTPRSYNTHRPPTSNYYPHNLSTRYYSTPHSNHRLPNYSPRSNYPTNRGTTTTYNTRPPQTRWNSTYQQTTPRHLSGGRTFYNRGTTGNSSRNGGGLSGIGPAGSSLSDNPAITIINGRPVFVRSR